MAKQGIYLDPIHPTDFLKLNITFYCEQCSHYDPVNDKCTMGYNPQNHKKEVQMKTYEISGRVAFCRHMEID
ncbi:MAG: hypothetical protein AB7F59_02965 [Bdellovibrionales bacterium]